MNNQTGSSSRSNISILRIAEEFTTTKSRVSEEAERDIQNRLDGKQAARDVVTASEKFMPANTKNAYYSKQKAFTNWCINMREYSDGDSVTEKKLLLWLKHVTELGNTQQKYAGAFKPLGLETIKMHTKAIVNLWTRQRLLDPENTRLAHPRGPSIKLIERNLAKACYDNKVAQHEDTGKSTIQDEYTFEQYAKLVEQRINEFTQEIKQYIDNNTRSINALVRNNELLLGLLRNNGSSSASALSSDVAMAPETPATPVEPAAPATPATTVAPPCLSKNTTTVLQLWNEWKVSGSRCTNFVPVKHLNRTLGAKWRSAGKDRAFYSRRKTVIDEVEKRVAAGKSVDEAIEECQSEISTGTVCKGLDSYTTYLRKRTASADRHSL